VVGQVPANAGGVAWLALGVAGMHATVSAVVWFTCRSRFANKRNRGL
jgi:hypothetical protein